MDEFLNQEGAKPYIHEVLRLDQLNFSIYVSFAPKNIYGKERWLEADENRTTVTTTYFKFSEEINTVGSKQTKCKALIIGSMLIWWGKTARLPSPDSKQRISGILKQYCKRSKVTKQDDKTYLILTEIKDPQTHANMMSELAANQREGVTYIHDKLRWYHFMPKSHC